MSILPEPLRRYVPQAARDMVNARLFKRRNASAFAGLKAHMERIRKTPGTAWDYKVFSQNGEDGIVAYLVDALGISGSSFVEFGFGATENNTLAYAIRSKASGLYLDASSENCKQANRHYRSIGIKAKAACAWITRDNINHLISTHIDVNDVEILSIDVDGNDYWLWEAITAVTPSLVIVEYNASFGPVKSVSTPYDPDFDRHAFHHTSMCHGMSLKAAETLGRRKGYSLVCCDAAGVNAFFARSDLLSRGLREIDAESAFRVHGHRLSIPQAEQERLVYDAELVSI